MHWQVLSFVVLSGLFAPELAEAQEDTVLHPCTFLTAPEITAAVGTAGQSAEGDMPGKAKMRACSWSIPGGLLTLSVGKVPNPNQSTRELLDGMNSMYDMLKAQGWKYEKKDLGSTSCSMVTPPAGEANAAPATFCATVRKGMLVMASASSKASIAAEKLAPLAEKAVARLPGK
jgi:hypothetical protein